MVKLDRRRRTLSYVAKYLQIGKFSYHVAGAFLMAIYSFFALVLKLHSICRTVFLRSVVCMWVSRGLWKTGQDLSPIKVSTIPVHRVVPPPPVAQPTITLCIPFRCRPLSSSMERLQGVPITGERSLLAQQLCRQESFLRLPGNVSVSFFPSLFDQSFSLIKCVFTPCKYSAASP